MMGDKIDSFGLPEEVAQDEFAISKMISDLKKMKSGKSKHVVADIDRALSMLKIILQSLRQ
jgi:hypothetical protein